MTLCRYYRLHKLMTISIVQVSFLNNICKLTNVLFVANSQMFKLFVAPNIMNICAKDNICYNFIFIINVNGILTNKVAMRFLFKNCPTCRLPDISAGYQIYLRATRYICRLPDISAGYQIFQLFLSLKHACIV